MGSKKVVNRSFEVKNTHQVACELPMQLRLMQGEPEGLAITTDDNLLPWLVVEKVGPELQMRWKEGAPQFRDFTLRGQLLMKEPRQFNLSGVADLEATALHLPRFTYLGTGASTASFSGVVPELALSLSGSSVAEARPLKVQRAVVQASGSSSMALWADQSLDMTLSGSAALDANTKATRRVSAIMGGSTSAAVWAVEELVATASGSSDLTYVGEPKRKQVDLSGSAAVASEAAASQ